MENVPNVSIAQRLAIEKQLLREEKYIVHALKTVKKERHALQREGVDLLCLLKDVLSQGKSSNTQYQNQVDDHNGKSASLLGFDIQPTTSKETLATSNAPAKLESASLMEDFNLASFDDTVSNEVELNLTVPSHNCYDQIPEEEYEEMETEDDFEIEMGMLMNGVKDTE